MKLIFGLGNPEAKYDNTPHNVGFETLDLVAKELGTSFAKRKMNGLCAEAVFEGEKVFLIKPQTYMNLSGECVQKWVKKFKVPLANVLVVLDDIDIELGSTRFRESGSGGTHNGLKNIVALVGNTVPRLKLGVGQAPRGMDLADYVLKKIDEPQKAPIENAKQMAKNQVMEFLKTGTVETKTVHTK
ncbi:MAG: aminoacyl-tRNA hydrolase [Clostridia bacterium]|nr:aminoacyl-tRNA hydrolase [Clostridia bacterium]